MFVIAKGAPTKYETTQDAMNSAPEIDTTININIPKSQTLKEEKKYKCTCCGNSWNVQKSRFSMSQSVLYQSNNGYINICNDCRDKYYYQLIDLYSGSEEKAIEHMCRQFGWIYHIDALEASRQVSIDRSRISHYLAKKNLGQTKMIGTTDIDTIKHEFINRKSEVIETFEDVKDAKKAKLKSVKFFGTGFEDDDYAFLQEQYDDWTTRHECKTKSQEEVFKRICFKQLELLKATRAGLNTKDLDRTLQDLLATGNLQPKQNNMDALAEDRTFGQLIKIWENEKPIPEPEEEFRDVDKIGKYISVFFLGHLAKMVGIKNKFARMYEAEMNKYTVQKPEYEEDSEALFDAIFGGHLDNSKDGDSDG